MNETERQNRRAMVLVEAAYTDDETAAKRWGVSSRTIRTYRKLLESNEELAAIFQTKKAAYEAAWAEQIPAAMRKAIAFLDRAFESLEPTPETIHAVSGSLKILAEVGLTKQLLDLRFGSVNNGFTQEN